MDIKGGITNEKDWYKKNCHTCEYIIIDNQTIQIKQSLFNLVSKDLVQNLKTIKINYPEIFVD